MCPIITLRSPLSPSPPPSPTKFSPRRSSPAAGTVLNLQRLTVTCQAACQAQPFANLCLRSPPPSLYDVLRVKRSATMTEIKCAYRTLAKLCHPDALGRSDVGSEGPAPDVKDFIVLHDAYTTLSDPAARARYDISLGRAARAGRGAGRGVVGFYGPGFGPTRRWETDQFW